jgi:hypothetical protein
MFYTVCYAEKMHSTKTPVRNKKDVLLYVVCGRKIIMKTIPGLDREPCAAEITR